MARKDQTEKNREKVKAVIELLKKQAPLTVRQEKFCNYACVGLFLKAKGDNVKKTAKHLRACLSWRDSIGIEYLIADEFSAELAEGFAYVAGHDNESRPVVIFRIKQDYQKFNSQKLFMRLLVFTLEVAIGTMPKNVEQFVLLFDASFYRSASAYMNFLLASLKIVSEYYPGRLHKAFIIDPPSLFSYLWKGVRPFVDLSTVTMVVSSLDYEESEDDDFSSYPRASSLRFDPSSIPSTGKISSSCSTRFAFTVSQHSDSLKPWYLSLKDTSASSTSTASSPSASLVGPAISPLNARSFSFASPAARTPRCSTPGPTRKKTNQCFTSTPLPQRVSNNNGNPRTPKPSFLQSPAMFFRKDKDCHVVSRTEKSRESFLPFLRFYRRPYDEMDYRSKMKPPLGGLISIVSPHIKNRHHMSQSQRF